MNIKINDSGELSNKYSNIFKLLVNTKYNDNIEVF